MVIDHTGRPDDMKDLIREIGERVTEEVVLGLDLRHVNSKDGDRTQYLCRIDLICECGKRYEVSLRPKEET